MSFFNRYTAKNLSEMNPLKKKLVITIWFPFEIFIHTILEHTWMPLTKLHGKLYFWSAAYEKTTNKVYINYKQVFNLVSYEDARRLVDNIFVELGDTGRISGLCYLNEKKLFSQLDNMANKKEREYVY